MMKGKAKNKIKEINGKGHIHNLVSHLTRGWVLRPQGVEEEHKCREISILTETTAC